tara:strand:+ start:184 stop:429 length:246 start_codon:yes stop_codon:yes gene_type:complete
MPVIPTSVMESVWMITTVVNVMGYVSRMLQSILLPIVSKSKLVVVHVASVMVMVPVLVMVNVSVILVILLVETVVNRINVE